MTVVATRVRYIFGILSIVLLGVVSLLVVPPPSIQSPSILAFLGRLHPIAVHFPIVLVPTFTVYYLFIRQGKIKEYWSILKIGWLITIGSTVVAVSAGYLLYASGDYGGKLVQLHLQGSVLVAVLLLIGALLAFQSRTPRQINRVLAVLLAANVALVYTGHQGGSLTHGEGFLADALPRASEASLLNKPLNESGIYQDLVRPILEARCMSCHNENKTKGDLNLATYPLMKAGGKSGDSILVAGLPEESELYRRIVLPQTDDEVMPPTGKSRLKQVELDLIEWWISEGADQEMLYGAGPADSMLASQIERYVPNLRGAHIQRIRSRQEFRSLYTAFKEAVTPLGLDVRVDADSDSSLFAVSVQFPSSMQVNDNTIAALRPYASYISSLSLVGTEISDDAFFHIAAMENLQELYVPNTAVDGSGMVYLKELAQLELLNLSNTELANPYVFHIAALPHLSTLYIFNTEVEPSIEEALATYRPDVDVRQEEGPFNIR